MSGRSPSKTGTGGILAGTSPALFHVCLGLSGLGLAWRRASGVYENVPSAVGAVILLAAVCLTTASAIAYGVKVIRCPGTITFDLQLTAARGALPSLAMALMVLAAGILPQVPEVARMVWLLGFGAQIVFLALVLVALARMNAEKRTTNPYLFLALCGFIVAPIAGVKLGYEASSAAIYTACLPVYFVILAGSVKNVLLEPVTPSLRPAQVVHMVPVACFGLAAANLGYSADFAVCVFLSGLLALILVLWSGWVAEGGWRPSWGAMIFPVASFAYLQLIATGRGFGLVAHVLAILALGLGTLLALYVTWRTMQAWLRGDLAQLSLPAAA